MTREEFAEELDNIIDASTGFTEGNTEEYTRELAEHDEELANALAAAFAALDRVAEVAISLKEEDV